MTNAKCQMTTTITPGAARGRGVRHNPCDGLFGVSPDNTFTFFFGLHDKWQNETPNRQLQGNQQQKHDDDQQHDDEHDEHDEQHDDDEQKSSSTSSTAQDDLT
mmetsp:Transcript_3628/g.9211  ORF Transcript_3628/g.9211 Transcript_3628/m.9211 type:complete len:103 (-) Transcript_3628:26-334(-)